MMDAKELRRAAEAAGQGQLFRFWDELDEAGRRHLAEEVAALDFAELDNLTVRRQTIRLKIKKEDDL